MHDGRDFGVRLVEQHLLDGQAARQHAVAVHHEHLVGVLGQLVEAAQIAQHHFQRHVLTHAHELEVHASAHRILGVGHGGTQLLALLGGQLTLDLLHHRRRQILDQVGHVVGVQLLHRRDQLVLGHQVDQVFQNRLGNLQQHGAIGFALDRIPDQLPLFRRQRFKHVGDVGRVQLGQTLTQLGKVGRLVRTRLDLRCRLRCRPGLGRRDVIALRGSIPFPLGLRPGPAVSLRGHVSHQPGGGLHPDVGRLQYPRGRPHADSRQGAVLPRMDVMANRLMVGIPLPGIRVPPRVCRMPGSVLFPRRRLGRPGIGTGLVPCLGRRVMLHLAMGMCPVVERGILLVVGLLRRLAHGFGVVAGRFLRKGVALQQQLHFGQRMLRVFSVARENTGLGGCGGFFRCFRCFSCLRGRQDGFRQVRMRGQARVGCGLFGHGRCGRTGIDRGGIHGTGSGEQPPSSGEEAGRSGRWQAGKGHRHGGGQA